MLRPSQAARPSRSQCLGEEPCRRRFPDEACCQYQCRDERWRWAVKLGEALWTVVMPDARHLEWKGVALALELVGSSRENEPCSRRLRPCVLHHHR